MTTKNSDKSEWNEQIRKHSFKMYPDLNIHVRSSVNSN